MSVHLHVRSCYSLLDSTLSIEQIVHLAKKQGFSSVACTDKNVMHGAMEFFACCKKENVKPLIGLELSLEIDDYIIPCVVLAKDDLGIKNCIKASSYLSGKNDRLPFELYQEFETSWITIIFGEGGLLEPACTLEDQNQICFLLEFLKTKINDFYIGLSYQESSFWRMKNDLLKKCCIDLNIKTVALPKVYYGEENDAQLYRIITGIRTAKTVQDKTLAPVSGRYMTSALELSKMYAVDDLKQTEMIAQMCNIEMNLEKTTLPSFECPNDLSSSQYLTQLCVAGLKKRYHNRSIPKEVQNRLKYELDVIMQMHFEDYFLIVWDFIRFARIQKIYVGPGRGSAAGSLVSYCLGITHVDPIEHGLLFERFLNPERISMPDIDTDFPDDRRDEVIQYVKEKYGSKHIAQIATFGTLGAKQVLRDVGRVLDVPLRKVDTLSKAVPFSPKMTLDLAMQQSDRFKQIIFSDPQLIELFQYAKKLEGLPRHVSLHAAGIVMSKLDLDEIIPTIQLDQNTIATQYTMEYMEELGLIKMDFLGLRNLTIIDEIVQRIKNDHPTFDIMRIPMDDKNTFDCIQAVDTVGIFQLESDGMKNLIRKMKPNCFDDIVATIALFRPGPMENIPMFLENKANPSKVTYLHPHLKPILESTYGVMIYQEQIMQVAQVMAGFTLSKADILRKAMSKKKADELLKLEKDFIDGCISKGHSKELAEELYRLVMKFANYGFNKSHSVAYGMIAYQMAYLKANAPLEFFTALLNSVVGSESKTAEYIDECRKRGNKILSPSVNFSSTIFTIENNQIRFPLLAIKNVGDAACRELLKERESRGPFIDYYDFVSRIMTRRFNRKTIEALIDAGALDEFKMNRKSMLLSLVEAISYADLVRVEIDGQARIDLGLVSKPVPIVAKEDFLERSEREKEALGFYLSSHPIIQIKQEKNVKVESLAALRNKMGRINGFALITRVKQHLTKKGQMMAFVSVVDESSDFDLVFMPNTYSLYNSFLEKGIYLTFEGKKDKDNSCIVQSCVKIDIN